MKIKIVRATKKHIILMKTKFEENFVRRVTDPTYDNYTMSFYFKNKMITFKKLFNKEEDFLSLLKFFKYKQFDKTNLKDFDIFWKMVYPKLDTLMIELVKQNPKAFLLDKRLSIYAKRFLIFDHIDSLFKNEFTKESILTLKENNTIINILRINRSYNEFSGIKSLGMEEMLTDAYIKKNVEIDTKEIKCYFGKDILSSLVSLIKEGSENIDSLNITTFFNKKDIKIKTTVDFYIEETINIVNSKLYLRKRKNLNITSVTKKNFRNFMSEYLKLTIKDNHNVFNIYKFMKDKKIKFKGLRIDRSLDRKEELYYLVKYINCNTDYDTKLLNENLNIKRYTSINEYLINYEELKRYKKELFNISKYINAKKYTYKTKKLLIENKKILNYLMDSKDRKFRELIIKLIDNLKNLNVNEKTIRGFLSKFFNKDLYFEKETTFIRESHKAKHNIIETTLKNFNNLFSVYLENKFDKQLFLNSIIKLISHINLDETSLVKLNKITNYLIINLDYIKEKEDKRLSKLSDFFELIGEIEKDKNKILVEKIKCLNISNNAFNIAMKMDRYTEYLKLLTNIANSKEIKDKFNTVSKIKEEIEISNDKYYVKITSHNNDIGMIGANVQGVCISSYGNHRLSQITNNFNNLIVYNKDIGIMIWGLLCRAINKKGEVIYILNNLQGSINNHSVNAEEVMNDIYDILRQFKKKNLIKEIVFLNHGFNALKLESKRSIKIDSYDLCEEIRLDFKMSQEFLALEDKN